jgi:hypothetical protein
MALNVSTTRVTLTELEITQIYQNQITQELQEKMRRELLKIQVGLKTTRTKAAPMDMQLGFTENNVSLSVEQLIATEEDKIKKSAIPRELTQEEQDILNSQAMLDYISGKSDINPATS